MKRGEKRRNEPERRAVSEFDAQEKPRILKKPESGFGAAKNRYL
jgi:hypothetical protein